MIPERHDDLDDRAYPGAPGRDEAGHRFITPGVPGAGTPSPSAIRRAFSSSAGTDRPRHPAIPGAIDSRSSPIRAASLDVESDLP